MPGNGCASSFGVGDLPFTGGGDLATATGTLASCCGVACGADGSGTYSGREHVWLFTPPYTGMFRVESPSAHPLVISAGGQDRCVDFVSGCVEPMTDTNDVFLLAGEPVAIVVEEQVGLPLQYELLVSESDPCLPLNEVSTPQEGCASATEITELPFFAEGTSCGGFDNHAFGTDWCPGYKNGHGKGTVDVTYVFVPTETGVYTLNHEMAENNGPSVLSVLTDYQQTQTSCAAAALPTSSDARVFMEAGKPHWIVLDHYKFNQPSDVCGGYLLGVTGPCKPVCDGKSCGHDGCGLSCGECDPGAECDEWAGQCAFPQGESCEAPHLVDALPFVDGGSGSNAVYRFVPQRAGRYEASWSAQFSGGIEVATQCKDPKKSWFGPKSARVIFDSQAGEEHHITVHGAPGSKGYYTVRLRRAAELLINEVDGGHVELLNPHEIPHNAADFRLQVVTDQGVLSDGVIGQGVVQPGQRRVVTVAIPDAGAYTLRLVDVEEFEVDVVAIADDSGPLARCPDGADTDEDDDLSEPYLPAPGLPNLCCGP